MVNPIHFGNNVALIHDHIYQWIYKTLKLFNSKYFFDRYVSVNKSHNKCKLCVDTMMTISVPYITYPNTGNYNLKGENN